MSTKTESLTEAEASSAAAPKTCETMGEPCTNEAKWRATADCCSQSGIDLCDHHKEDLELYLAMMGLMGSKVACIHCQKDYPASDILIEPL